MLKMNGLFQAWLGVGLTGCILCALSSASQAEIPITIQGQAVATIVSNGYEEQAQVLGKYLKAITGADIPVIEKIPAEEQILQLRPFVILEVADSIPGISDTPKGKQGYRICTDGTRLRLTGRSEMGLTYAVYGLLEDYLGLRFYGGAEISPYYTPTQAVEIIPKNENLSVDKINDTQEPAFAFRGFIWNSEGTEHEIKNRGRGFPDTQSHHSFYSYIPPDKYFGKHPEWFPVINGQRAHHWSMAFCYTNEQLAEELANRVMEEMAKWENPGVPIRVGQGDAFQACECEICRRAVAEEGSEAGPIILMLNRVLEKTTKRFPEHQIITFAYFDTLKPPRNIRPHPNLWINVVSSAIDQSAAGDQLGRIRNNPRNKDYMEAIQGWPKIAPGRVVVWDWAEHFFQPFMEWPNILDVADNIRFFAENDVNVVKLQICFGNGNWGRLRRWLWLKMMWNPNQDEAKLTQQFLNGYYGPRAGAILWEYIQYTHQVVDESGYRASVCRGPAFIHNHGGLVFNKDNLKRMKELITAAEQAAALEADPVFAERVAGIRPTSIDTFELPVKKDLNLANVQDPRDASVWLVPGGRADMPALIDRGTAAYGNISGGGGHPWYYRHLFTSTCGGPIARLENEQLACEVVPNLNAQITSLVHIPTGQELVALDGYEDTVEAGFVVPEWSVTKAAPEQLDLEARLQFNTWEHYDNMRLQRRLRLDGGTPRLTIDLDYRSLQGPKRIPDSLRFSSRWNFRVPQPHEAKLHLAGGGLSESLSIEGAQKQTFELNASKGDLMVTLDRGDGLVLELSAPAKGFDKLTLEPNAEKGYLTLLLSGVPHPMSQESVEIDLPTTTLEVKTRQR